MRIIAGKLGGQNFTAPPGHRTHPMSDKIRGALFNVLGDIDDLTILDAFAGSGAVGFEAISRGARSVTAIESDHVAQRTIAANAEQLGIEEQFKLIRANAGAWLSTSSDQFSIVICDPPYDAVQSDLLKRLAECVEPTGIVVFSLPPSSDPILDDSRYENLSVKNYGDAELWFYRRGA